MQLLKLNRIMNDIDILNELFEDVSLEYNREEKITNLLD